MFSDSFFYNLNSSIRNFQDMMGWTAHAHTRLYTSDGAGILVADDSSMVSLISLDGTLRLVGDEEFDEIVERLNDILSVTLSKRCHAVQFVAQYDPIGVVDSVARHFAPIHKSAKALHLDLKNVLDDWRDNITSYCADEHVYIAVWTRPTAISRAELKKEKVRIRKEPGNAVSKSCQGRNVVNERLRDIHRAQTDSIVNFFRQFFYKARILGSHEAVHAIRKIVLPDMTAEKWRPTLPGDRLLLRRQKPGSSSREASHIFPPTIARQIWTTSAKLRTGKYVEIGNRVYAPFIMELPPQNLREFNELFQSLKGEIPWRLSILLTGDGLTGSQMKSSISSILSFAGVGNKMFNIAHKQLNALQLDGACMVGFQAAFTTWVEKDHPHCLEVLSRRSARLQSAVQAWGSCETADMIGDALLAFTATVPALMPTSPAPAAIAPLKEALVLLPMTRPTSPWTDTDLPLRTPDGRFMPVGLFHSNMSSWNEIAFAGMGAGKSFFLNTLNFFFVLRPGQARLPWLTIIDIGPSCSGVINLIQAALPSEMKHLAIFARLRNAASSAINPFDTPLGCSQPLRNHFEFLNNLLSLICTPLDKTAPVDGVSALLREAVAHMYKAYSPKGDLIKKFDPHMDPFVTEALKEHQYVWDSQTTWWEVVDFFFGMKMIPQAIRAQRFAMPTIADLAMIVTNRNVSENFASIRAGEGGETVPEACSRYLVSAITEYPMLANPTKFALGAAQIVGLDLMEVTPRGGYQAARQSGIMYMMARFIGAAHFFNTIEDIELIPEQYREYHRPRFENLAADPKRLCYDEFHRASCTDQNNPLSRQIISDLTTASRESRKLNLSIGLYSQQLDDFPKVLVSLATSVYALGAGNAQEAREIAERFGYNTAALNALRRITRPTAAGANFVAMFRTAQGESIQYLTNSAGGYARWAFSTTAEDMRLRNKLYAAIGCQRTLEILQRQYPEGSVKPEIERRKMALDQFDGEAVEDIELSIFKDLLKQVKNGSLSSVS